MARSPIDGGTVLVTGASSGIGEAFARQLAPRAQGLALLARRRDRLQSLGDALAKAHPALEVVVVPADLMDRAATDAALDAVAERLGAIDVLINNAGLGDLSLFDKSDWKKNARMIDLNVTALAYLTHRVLPSMVERGRGGVINVSSGFGLQFMPGFASYIGTKHFVSGFTESLRLDLHGTGVRATQVCPGPVDTEFESKVGNFIGRSPPSFVVIGADRAARAAIGAFDRDRALVVPGFWMKILVTSGQWTPRWVLRRLFRHLAPPLRRAQEREAG